MEASVVRDMNVSAAGGSWGAAGDHGDERRGRRGLSGNFCMLPVSCWIWGYLFTYTHSPGSELVESQDHLSSPLRSRELTQCLPWSRVTNTWLWISAKWHKPQKLPPDIKSVGNLCESLKERDGTFGWAYIVGRMVALKTICLHSSLWTLYIISYNKR